MKKEQWLSKLNSMRHNYEFRGNDIVLVLSSSGNNWVGEISVDDNGDITQFIIYNKIRYDRVYRDIRNVDSTIPIVNGKFLIKRNLI